jgi:hypothetical protein
MAYFGQLCLVYDAHAAYKDNAMCSIPTKLRILGFCEIACDSTLSLRWQILYWFWRLSLFDHLKSEERVTQ